MIKIPAVVKSLLVGSLFISSCQSEVETELKNNMYEESKENLEKKLNTLEMAADSADSFNDIEPIDFQMDSIVINKK